MIVNTQKVVSVLFLISMQTFQLSIIFSANFVTQSQAATALEEIKETPDHPGKCYIKNTGIAYSLGATWQVPEMGCAEASCYRSETPNKLLVAYQTCGLVSADPGCEIVQDSSQPYPSCCPIVRCDAPVLQYDSVDYDSMFLPSNDINSDDINEIDEWRLTDLAPQTNSNSQPFLSFEDQERIVEELAKKPSNLFDVLMNPNKLNSVVSSQKRIDPLLVRLP